MNVELDVEKRLQAVVAKDRIRIREFFIDFDKLRKGQVGVAHVSINQNHTLHFVYTIIVQNMPGYIVVPILRWRNQSIGE